MYVSSFIPFHSNLIFFFFPLLLLSFSTCYMHPFDQLPIIICIIHYAFFALHHIHPHACLQDFALTSLVFVIHSIERRLDFIICQKL